MSTVSEIAEIARNYLRDFPKFFQVSFDLTGRTYELGRTNIDVQTFWAATYTTGASVTAPLTSSDYSLDHRNGVLRLAQSYPAGSKLMVEGYNYQWIAPGDMEFYAQMAVHLNTHNLDIDLDDASPAVKDVIGIQALVEALWALLTEFSRDIDVMTSESIHIPASQRYRMVQSLLDMWEGEYSRRAKALNIGLERIEVFNLRRISRTSNRLVPIYKAKEVGDFSPLERVWVPIDDGSMNLEKSTEDEQRIDVYIDGEPPASYVPNTTAYY